ncbi:MAG: hypothetical protein Q8M96_06490 [Rubrivivax sp.]|nr:hypothetical protein [Rubrivivax sp.]
MTAVNDLARMVPGFEFLQGLMKNAGAGIPGMGQWIAPTLNPEELEKRIHELKTVHFWLEQNAKLLATTIQALEVQRMTLSTLQSMNLPLADLGEALKIRMPTLAPREEAVVPPPAPPPAPAPAAAAASAPAPATPAPPAVDPMQWWGALTQQFTELATQAVKDSAAGALVKGSMDSAAGALKKATAAPAKSTRAAKPARAPAARKRSR